MPPTGPLRNKLLGAPHCDHVVHWEACGHVDMVIENCVLESAKCQCPWRRLRQQNTQQRKGSSLGKCLIARWHNGPVFIMFRGKAVVYIAQETYYPRTDFLQDIFYVYH